MQQHKRHFPREQIQLFIQRRSAGMFHNIVNTHRADARPYIISDAIRRIRARDHDPYSSKTRGDPVHSDAERARNDGIRHAEIAHVAIYVRTRSTPVLRDKERVESVGSHFVKIGASAPFGACCRITTSTSFVQEAPYESDATEALSVDRGGEVQK
jgi:hypothetical protein